MTASRSVVLALPLFLVIAPHAHAYGPLHLVPPLLLADLQTPPAATPGAAPSTTPAQPPKVPATGDMNFDFFEEKKTNKEEDILAARKLAELEKKTKIRRNVIQAHQAIGFATLALLAATVVLGQLNYYDKFASGGDYTGKYDTAHYALSIGATAGFTVTGLLGLFAPNPYPKPIKFDTALVHKIAMAVAAACFLGDIILGPISAQVEPGKLDQRALAQAHLALGYGAMGFMTIGTLVYVF